MSSASDLAEYFADLAKRGCGELPVFLGTRGLESLRPTGRMLRLEKPQQGEETNGFAVFLRAADGD